MIKLSMKELLERSKDVKIGVCYKCGKKMACDEAVISSTIKRRWWTCEPCDWSVCEVIG